MLRRLATATVVLALATVVPAACSGSDERPASSPTTGPADGAIGDPEALAYPVFDDPAVPVFVGLGRRFGIALPADASSGERWVITDPPDRAVVVPLGTEFTAGPWPPDGPQSTTGSGSGAPSRPTADPDTGVRPGGVQVLTFAAAGFGTTTIGFRPTRGAADPGDDRDPVTFTVTVTLTGEPPPPPPEPVTTLAGNGAGGGGG